MLRPYGMEIYGNILGMRISISTLVSKIVQPPGPPPTSPPLKYY